MFKKRTLFAGFIICLIVGAISINLFYVSQRNRTDYATTLDILQPVNEKYIGMTQRTQVTKSLWIQEDGNLYQYFITSADSVLHLNQQKGTETKIVEDMEHAVCLLQQKMFYVNEKGLEVSQKDLAEGHYFPMQQVCRLEVNSGSYIYPSKKFAGDEVKIQVYEIPGHELTASPPFHLGKKLMEGECDHVDFFFIESAPNLKVRNLVAQIFGKE